MKGSSCAGTCNMPGRLGSPSSSELSDQRTKTSSILDNSQSLTSTISEEYSAIVKACRSNSVDALLTSVPSAHSSMDSQGEVGDSNGTGMRASNLQDSGGFRESSEASSCTKKKAVDDETLVQSSPSLNLVNVEDASQFFAGASAPETSIQHSWPIPKRMELRTSPCNVVAESSENASQFSTTAGAAQHPVTRRSSSLTVESRTRSSGNVCRAANPEDLSPDKNSEAGLLPKPDEALAAVELLTAKIEQEITPTKESELPAVSADSNPQGPKRRKTQQKRTILVSVVGNGAKSSSEDVSADLWAWRKYGQKPIKGSPYPRGYYRCSSSKGCLARKQVERSRNDPSKLIVSYTAEHNHPWPSHRNSLAGSTRVTSPHKEPSGSARTCSVASLEKQGSSDTAAELKAESEEPARPCDAHSMHEMVVQEEEDFANGADDASKAEIVSVTNDELLSGAITFSPSDTRHSTGSPGALHEPLNVDSSGQMQIVVQSYTESHEHLMLESLSRSSMEDEDFFAELEELPDSSMAVFGWGSFLEDQSDDEGVGTTVVDPYNLFCWSTTSSVKSKAVI